MSEQFFHFTIGPVQEFVSQARRTRDFWGGSFLLSWLSSVTVEAVRRQGGEISFPHPDENYLSWLVGQGEPESEPPRQATIPNRFRATTAKVPGDFQPMQVIEALRTAWRGLADLVWIEDLASFRSAQRDGVRSLWEAQIDNFWDLSWCLSDKASASDLLDRRKNWRCHVPISERGMSCMMMDGWRELSGFEAPGENLRSFWQGLRASDDSFALDLKEGEQLCAIAFVKRRFARHFSQLDIWVGDDSCEDRWRVVGWPLPLNVPSTNYLAASPWLAHCISMMTDNPQLSADIQSLHADLSCLGYSQEGRTVNLKRVADASTAGALEDWSWQFTNGRFLYIDELELMIKREDLDANVALLKDCVKTLSRVYQHTGRPSDFYAILLMDGDSLGSQMSDLEKQQGISKALADFTARAGDIVESHSGFLVYAGGDDVLAMLSVDDALPCAEALRLAYDECFDSVNRSCKSDKISTSLSGAVIYSHYKRPLTTNLARAHYLLDEVAKARSGRNSVAVEVHKPGGLHCQWFSPWDPEGQSIVAELVALIERLLKLASASNVVPRKFFFKLESLIQELGLEASSAGLPDSNIEALFRAAWLHTGAPIDKMPASMSGDLLALLRVWYRNTDGQIVRSGGLTISAIKTLHFLVAESLPVNVAIETTQEVPAG